MYHHLTSTSYLYQDIETESINGLNMAVTGQGGFGMAGNRLGVTCDNDDG